MKERAATPPPLAGDQKPASTADGQEVPHTRRQDGGARREATERITLKREGFETTGWSLNVSRGGVRLVLEDPVEEQTEYDVVMPNDEVRRGRIAWVKDAADGQIVGVQFLDLEGTVPPPPAGDER